MLNEAQLIGRVGKDPEIRYLPDSTIVANFSLATTKNWKDEQGNKHESTEWHRISAFGFLADTISKYVKKGSLVFVRGSIHTREYEKDGIKRYSTEIRAQTLKMLGDGSRTEKPEATQQAAPAGDDLPF